MSVFSCCCCVCGVGCVLWYGHEELSPGSLAAACALASARAIAASCCRLERESGVFGSLGCDRRVGAGGSRGERTADGRAGLGGSGVRGDDVGLLCGGEAMREQAVEVSATMREEKGGSKLA